MKKFLAVLVLLVSVSFAQAQNWTCDASHSNVLFTVDHLVISEVQGYFRVFDGKMTSTKDDLTDANIEFSIDASSINTDNDYRDKHLKSEDFFNSEKFPKIKFRGTSITKVSDGVYRLTGMMTIRDISKEVTFDLRYRGETKNGYGKQVRGFKAETSINRFDYNLKWNKATEMGGAIVGKDVKIVCNIEMVKS